METRDVAMIDDVCKEVFGDSGYTLEANHSFVRIQQRATNALHSTNTFCAALAPEFEVTTQNAISTMGEGIVFIVRACANPPLEEYAPVVAHSQPKTPHTPRKARIAFKSASPMYVQKSRVWVWVAVAVAVLSCVSAYGCVYLIKHSK